MDKRVMNPDKSVMNPDKSYRVRHHVQLPDGKQIEVVYFDRRAPLEDPCASIPLHVCFHCGGELVYPLDWSEEGPKDWWIDLRCPECGSRREGVFEQAAVEHFDDVLDRAAHALLGDLRRMTQANMSEEIDLFVRALDLDLIGPSDFDRYPARRYR